MGAVAKLERLWAEGLSRPQCMTQESAGAPLLVKFPSMTKAHAKVVAEALVEELRLYLAHYDWQGSTLQLHLNAHAQHADTVRNIERMLKPAWPSVIVTIYMRTGPGESMWLAQPVNPFYDGFTSLVTSWQKTLTWPGHTLLKNTSFKVMGRLRGDRASRIELLANAFCDAHHLNPLRTVYVWPPEV